MVMMSLWLKLVVAVVVRVLSIVVAVADIEA
jgi:hypothetical protein